MSWKQAQNLFSNLLKAVLRKDRTCVTVAKRMSERVWIFITKLQTTQRWIKLGRLRSNISRYYRWSAQEFNKFEMHREAEERSGGGGELEAYTLSTVPRCLFQEIDSEQEGGVCEWVCVCVQVCGGGGTKLTHGQCQCQEQQTLKVSAVEGQWQ